MHIERPDAPTPTSVVHCANECDHGCGVPVYINENWITAALEYGWVVMLWETPGFEQEHAGGHSLAFCDAFCAYEAQRKKALRQQGPPDDLNYARRVVELEESRPARVLAEEFRSRGETIDHRHASHG